MITGKIFLSIAVIACILTGFAYGQDWLEGGNVQSFSRPSDPGIAGMVRWLDQPVYNPSFPWYTSRDTFYQRGAPEATFSPFRQYYTTSAQRAVALGQRVSTPVKYNMSQRTPTNVYYASGQGLPYSQYASIAPSRANDLWIQGTGNWSQYVVVPVGTWLQLVATAPVSGPGGFYEITQMENATLEYNRLQFYQGYNNISFNADRAGRHMLYFVVNNEPSNVVIMDVFSQAQQKM
jgi:hypothetical protein